MKINLTNPFSVSNSSVISAVGLFGLALYQFSQKDYASAIQSFCAGLIAVGVKIGQDKINETQLKMAVLNKKFNP